MKKVYYLKTCDTCRRIMQENNLDAEHGFESQDIKIEKISPKQLDALKKITGSFETIFSKKSKKYSELGLKDRNLSENDYRDLILEEYTFLKRPVILLGDQVFSGSDKKTMDALKSAITKQNNIK